MEKLEFKNSKVQPLFDAIMCEKPNINFSMLKTVLRKKDIKVNGIRVSDNISLNVNDIVCVFFPNKKEIKIDIVYEDDNIMVINKPQGMEVTKADKVFDSSKTVEEIFSGCWACHRLDKNTFGLLVLAKNEESREALFNMFKEHNLKKYYTAVAVGDVKTKGDKLKDYLVKKDNFVKIFSQEVPNSKVVLTNYELIKNNGDLHLLNIELLTGRTHQIRAHLAFHNIYIVGDQKYGKTEINKQYHKQKQQLCASKIIFGKLTGKLGYLSNKIFEIMPDFDIFN
ncbi:MAG: RluA family pseudouridine synthase [Clostridia bacterium]|nr:RluA family pseudouridine synthase [Clostridia bacterium]